MEMFHYVRSAILYFTFAVTINEKQKNISKGLCISEEISIY